MPPGPPDRQGPQHPPGPPRWPHEDWATVEKNDPELYKRLQEELKRLQDSIDKRKAAREQIVEKRVQELLGTDGGLRF